MLFRYKTFARNAAIAYSMVKQEYGDRFSEQQCQFAAGIMQCASVIRRNKDISPVFFDMAFGRARLGNCGYDVYYEKSIYKQPWYDRPKLSDLDIFCNYIMNVACIFVLSQKSVSAVKRVVNSVIRKRKAIYRQTKKVLSTNILLFDRRVAKAQYDAVMRDNELEDWKMYIYFDFE